MLGLWQLLPFSWRVVISVASLVLFGFSISPFSMALSTVFHVSQEKACEGELRKDYQSLSGLDNDFFAQPMRNWSNCLDGIASNPGIVDEYVASKTGRSLIFSKQAK